MNPKRIFKANAEIHDYWAEHHDKNVSYIRRKRARRFYWEQLCRAVAESKQDWRDARVLELGCGTGTYTDYCLEAGLAKYTGLDLSEKMLTIARTKYADTRVEFMQSSLADYAGSTATHYDVIFSLSFLHHLPDVAEGLQCIRALLAPDGVYVALHEVNTTRSSTGLEQLAARLEIVAGLNGYYAIPVAKRLAIACLGDTRPPMGPSFFARVLRRLHVYLTFSPLPKVPPTREHGVELVDFQLNEPFSLATKCAGAGRITNYCYFGFPELMLFGRPLNHEMLVMRKET